MRGAQTFDEENWRKGDLGIRGTGDADILFAQNNLEFELRLQQYIELLRATRIGEARQHAQKYIIPQVDTYPTEINRACGLFAYPPDTLAEPYKVCVLP